MLNLHRSVVAQFRGCFIYGFQGCWVFFELLFPASYYLLFEFGVLDFNIKKVTLNPMFVAL